MIYNRLIYISALIFTAACSTGKYIRKVPYHYYTDSFRKAAQAHKDSIDAKYTESNYKDQQLSEESYDIKYGARPLKGVIRAKLRRPLAKKIIAGEFKEGDSIIADWQEGKNVWNRKEDNNIKDNVL